jgi:alginate export protein
LRRRLAARPALCAALLSIAAAARGEDAPSPPPRAFTLHGELRERVESFDHAGWDPDAGRDWSLLQKFMLFAELQLTPRVRVFAAVKSGLEDGRNGGPRPTDEDRLDIHEAFVEAGRATGPSLRVGRRELALGSQRLVSTRAGPNVRQAFDGASIAFRHGAWSLDTFALKPVRTDPGILDDDWDDDRTFWGAYSVRASPSRAHGIDLYYLGLDRKTARYDQGTAAERRHSAGTRLWGRPAAWDYNFELVYQWGSFGSAPIRAWTVASDTGFTLAAARGRPRFGLKADITSGDEDPGDAALQSFNPLFPKGAYFGDNQLIGPVNHMDLHPSVEVHLFQKVTVTPSWTFFWRQSLRDGLYGVPGNLIRSGLGTAARYVGSQPALSITAAASRHVTVAVAFERFLAGPFLRASGPGADLTFLATSVAYVF